MRALVTGLGLAVLVAVSGSALAGDNDFRLNARKDGAGLLFQENAGSVTPNDERWRAFTTQLGYVFAPRLASPAETLGHSGFHVGVLWSGTFISADEAFWSVTEQGQRGAPRSMLQTLQLDVRKGLPFSLEIGTNFLWLIDSELFAPGLEVRWAIHEGYGYTPDFAVRGSVNHMIGNRDLLLTTAGFDGVLSKNFGLFGMVNVAPYLSWSLIFVAASSRVIDPTPIVEDDLEHNFVFNEIGATDEVHHKLTLGVRTIYYVLNVSVQGEFQMLDGGFFGSVATITTKLGLDY